LPNEVTKQQQRIPRQKPELRRENSNENYWGVYGRLYSRSHRSYPSLRQAMHLFNNNIHPEGQKIIPLRNNQIVFLLLLLLIMRFLLLNTTGAVSYSNTTESSMYVCMMHKTFRLLLLQVTWKLWKTSVATS